MGFDYQTTFSLIEWLALTGLVQSGLILVYILLRVRVWSQAAVALGYFTFLALSFGLQFSLRLEDFEFPIRFWLSFSRAMGGPLCYLLVLQVSFAHETAWRRLGILMLVPIAYVAAVGLDRIDNICDTGSLNCTRFFQTLSWFDGMAGALAMLALWFHKNIFSSLWNAKGGRERYWLVITLIVANILRIAVSLTLSVGYKGSVDADALHVTLGIAFAYLATTTLFRVYPMAVQISSSTRVEAFMLSEDEKAVAEKIRTLMSLEKVYHEATFSRADLAREVGVSENIVSRVINQAFGKSFPRLLNEYRVEDAKRMLQDPAIPINVLAFEVGFNSLASFNRVFRDVTGETPSQYRGRQKHSS